MLITRNSPLVLPLVSHYLLKSCRKSLQNVFDGVADCRAHCPGGLVYHVSSKGHIFTVKNKHRPFRRGGKKRKEKEAAS